MPVMNHIIFSFLSLSRLQIAFTTPVLGWTEYSLLYRSDSDLDMWCNVRCDFDCRYTAGTKFEVKCISLQRHWQIFNDRECLTSKTDCYEFQVELKIIFFQHFIKCTSFTLPSATMYLNLL